MRRKAKKEGEAARKQRRGRKREGRREAKGWSMEEGTKKLRKEKEDKGKKKS